MSQNKSPLESSLLHHVASCLRSDNHKLRAEVMTPSPELPITVLPFDVLETSEAERYTGQKLTLKPGCWIFSQEFDDEDTDGMWDTNNLGSLWLLDGTNAMWEMIRNQEILEGASHATHLLGYFGDCDGFATWVFVLPRDFTVNVLSDLIAVFGPPGWEPEPAEQTFIMMDVQFTGALLAQMLRDDMPVPQYKLDQFLMPHLCNVMDDILASKDPLFAKAVPSGAQLLVQTLVEAVPFDVDKLVIEQTLPIQGVEYGAWREVENVIVAKPDSRNVARVGIYVVAPLIDAPPDEWDASDMVVLLFVNMTADYWESELLEPDKFMLCVVHTLAGTRPWVYHVELDTTFDKAIPLRVGGTDEQLMAALDRPEVLKMDHSMIQRIGYLNAVEHKHVVWGEFEFFDDGQPDKPKAPDWLQKMMSGKL